MRKIKRMNYITYRAGLCLLVGMSLTACANTPMAKRSYDMPQRNAQVIRSAPVKAPEVAAKVPAAIATGAPLSAAIIKPALPTNTPLAAPMQKRTMIDNDPALSVPTVISIRKAPVKPSANAGDLLQRMRRGFAMSSRVNERIREQANRYTGQQKYIDELMDKASRFLFTAVTEAERRGLPTELALLPIIESAYDPSATSRSNAAGLWQFIPDTGRLYGLRQTAWFDARRDPLESTRAAYDYLAKLYGLFGDWDLVLASYNAGPGTVSRAIAANAARGLGTDYWSLNLSNETMDYVPRFLAVVSLFKDPASASISLPALANRPYFRTVVAKGTLDLDTVAALSGISLDELRTLNAALRRNQLAPDGPYLLHVPNSLDIASEQLLVQQSVASDVRMVNAQGHPEAVVATLSSQVIRANYIDANIQRYRVRRGDTWFSIARTNQLSTAQLALANNDVLSTPLDIGRELVVPSPAAAAYQAHVFSHGATREASVAPRSETSTQVIQAGNREL